MKIREYTPDDAGTISSLIRKTYDEYVAPDYPEEGNRHFYTFITPEALNERFLQPGHFIIIASEDGVPVGVIGIRDKNHLALMFVDKAFQGKGISRRLLEEAERKIATEPAKQEVTVFSSPYAVPIYRRLGFREEGKMQTKDGITFQPMKKDLSKAKTGYCTE